MEQEKVIKDKSERLNNGNNGELIKKSATVLTTTTTHSNKSLHTSQMQNLTEASPSNNIRHEFIKNENTKSDRDKHGTGN